MRASASARARSRPSQRDVRIAIAAKVASSARSSSSSAVERLAVGAIGGEQHGGRPVAHEHGLCEHVVPVEPARRGESADRGGRAPIDADRDAGQQHRAREGLGQRHRRGVEARRGRPLGDLVADHPGRLVRHRDGDELDAQEPHRLPRDEPQGLERILLVEHGRGRPDQGDARLGAAPRLLGLIFRVLIEPGVLDRHRGHAGKQQHDALVFVGERAIRRLGQVEVPEDRSAPRDRDAEEGAHRRMVGWEAHRARIVREVAKPERAGVVDQGAEHPAAGRRRAQQAALLVVEAGRDEAADAAVRAQHAERRVPCAGHACRRLHDRAQRLVEIEPAGHRDAGLRDHRELAVLCGGGSHDPFEGSARRRLRLFRTGATSVPGWQALDWAASWAGDDPCLPTPTQAHAAGI